MKHNFVGLSPFLYFYLLIVILLELACPPYNKDLNPITLGTNNSKKTLQFVLNMIWNFGHVFSLNSENPKYTMLAYLDYL